MCLTPPLKLGSSFEATRRSGLDGPLLILMALAGLAAERASVARLGMTGCVGIFLPLGDEFNKQSSKSISNCFLLIDAVFEFFL